VWAPERGGWVPASQLSKGTIDQVFLAARIGLVRLVTQGRRPPLVLDDPFVTFDDARAARAAILLRDLSADFQVIYLACSNRYDGLADAVVELPGPAEVSEPQAAVAEPAAAATPETPAGPAAPAASKPAASRGLASALLEEAQASAEEVAAAVERERASDQASPGLDGDSAPTGGDQPDK
jgi:hypothetical protein